MTTITQTITAMPTAPDPATMTRAQFNTAAAAFVLAQKAMGPEMNTMASQMNTVAGEVNANATTASNAETAAAASATTASAAAATAVNAPGTQATSTTSMAPSVASKAFTLAQTGKTFGVGVWVSVTDTSAPTTNWFAGPITAFNSGSGAITVNASVAVGSSTSTTWAINTSAPVINVHDLTAKTTPVDADEVGIVDSAASNAPKKVTWANIKAVLNTLYGLLGTGNTWTAAQIFSDQVVSRATLTDCAVGYIDKGNSGTSTQTFDYTAGSVQRLVVTGAHTIATSNWPPSGTCGIMALQLVNGASSAITWPTINWVKSDGSYTTTFSSNGVTLQTSGTDWTFLWTRDGGTNIFGKIMR